MKKYILILTFLVVLFSVYAENIDFHHKKSTILYYEDTCTIEDSANPCNANQCNLSVWYPNSTKLLDKGNMTITAGKDLNYTLSAINTATIGVYEYEIYCYNSTAYALKEGYFEINNTGEAKNENILGIFILMAILIVVSLVLTIYFSYQKSALRYFFLNLIFIFLTISIFIGYKYSLNNLTVEISQIMYVSYFISLILTLVIFMIVMLDLTLNLINYFMTKKSQNFKDTL